MDRKLYDYLPMFLHTVQELMALMNAEQPEANALWQATDDVMNERYVSSSSVYGVSRWEKILSITPKAAESLEERKSRIKQRIGSVLPYTMPWLKTSLIAQFGADKCNVILDKYTLYINVHLQSKDSLNALKTLISSFKEVMPVNIIIVCKVVFNVFELQAYGLTYGNLKAYSYSQIRDGILLEEVN